MLAQSNWAQLQTQPVPITMGSELPERQRECGCAPHKHRAFRFSFPCVHVCLTALPWGDLALPLIWRRFLSLSPAGELASSHLVQKVFSYYSLNLNS